MGRGWTECRQVSKRDGRMSASCGESEGMEQKDRAKEAYRENRGVSREGEEGHLHELVSRIGD